MAGALQVLLGAAAGVPPLAASASPVNVTGFRATNGTATTNAATVTPTGGVGPYTYDWEYVSGDATIVVNNDASATTTFSGRVSKVVPFSSAIWRCKVTDSAANITYSNNVEVSIEMVI